MAISDAKTMFWKPNAEAAGITKQMAIIDARAMWWKADVAVVGTMLQHIDAEQAMQ
jgi:hypothetical protein